MLQIVLTQSEPSARNRRPVGGGVRVAQAFGRLPPTTMLLLALLAVQLDSALATVLFSGLGPVGTAFASTLFSAAVLTALARPRLDGRIRKHAVVIVALLSAVLPMSLEYRVLQRMSARAYGILVTLEPAIGARMSIAVACVTIAALGVTLSDRHDDGN